MNDLAYFTSDNMCYKGSNDFSELSFNQYINDNFLEYTKYIKFNDHTHSTLVQDCVDTALQEEKDYFLITDISKSSYNDPATYKCLIPKRKNTNCISGNTYIHLIEPVNQLIRVFFSDIKETTYTTTISNNEYYFNDLATCSTLIYDPQNGGQTISGNFAKSGKYIIYKSNIVNKIPFDQLYNNKVKHREHRDTVYKENDYIYDDYIITEINDFKNAAINFLLKDTCIHLTEKNIIDYKANPPNFPYYIDYRSKTGKKNTGKKFNNDTYNELKNATRRLISLDISMNDVNQYLINDISYILNVTKSDSMYLNKIDNMIIEKKKEIKNLLGFDGANNGKLSDTKYLKNIKLSENIILFLVIVFIIFAYVKKKI